MLQSFLYKQEKAVGDKVYWKCRQHAGLGCRGRAITRGSRATVMRDHCHLPDEEGLQARRQQEKLPSPALPEAPDGSGGPVDEPLEGGGSWLCPEEPQPHPGQALSKPAPEEAPRALSLLLPPKKRSMLGLGEHLPRVTEEFLPRMPPFGVGEHGWPAVCREGCAGDRPDFKTSVCPTLGPCSQSSRQAAFQSFLMHPGVGKSGL